MRLTTESLFSEERTKSGNSELVVTLEDEGPTQERAERKPGKFSTQ